MTAVDEKDINEQLSLKWTMIKYSRDDPFLEAKLIISMEELYDKHSVKMPNDIKRFIIEEKTGIGAQLKRMIAEKKSELETIKKSREEKAQKQEDEYREKIEEEKLSKMTRTQQIFGA